MTMFTPTAGTPHRPFSSITRSAHWIAAAIHRRRVRHRTVRISHLSEHLLRDVGLEHYARHDPAIPANWQ